MRELCIVEEYCNKYINMKYYESFLLKLIIVIAFACLPLVMIYYCIIFIINGIRIHFLDKKLKNE